MAADSQTLVPEIGLDDFTRRFSKRGANLMWLLGAGASAAAGVATADEMIWEFKQQLFVSQRKVSLRAVSNLSDPVIRQRLQAHIESSPGLPGAGEDDEYAALFEAVYPAEGDRRTYIDAKVAGAKPSYGHVALSALMKADLVRLVWTTNFDSLVEDACASEFNTTTALSVIATEMASEARNLISMGRWPILVKLHGDYRSRRLRNTADELRYQDQALRKDLIASCHMYGLIVVGYSGRDNSIMDALHEALDGSQSFPGGLFWLHHGDEPPTDRVVSLLRTAAECGTEAALVRIENFDETLRDIVRLTPNVEMTRLDAFAGERKRCSPAPIPSGSVGWPAVRLNALRLLETPTVCRRVVCGIGGFRELRDAIAAAGVNILAARTRKGVLAYGADDDVRAVLEPYDITEFDLHSIDAMKLRKESHERGLLREALVSALSRSRGISAVRRRSADLLSPTDPADARWEGLRAITGVNSGVVSGCNGLRWSEGIALRIDWAADSLNLLVEPRIVFHGLNPDNRAFAADFARERTVKRYNRNLDQLITFWTKVLVGEGDELRALGINYGVDAVFRLSDQTSISWRAQA